MASQVAFTNLRLENRRPRVGWAVDLPCPKPKPRGKTAARAARRMSARMKTGRSEALRLKILAYMSPRRKNPKALSSGTYWLCELEGPFAAGVVSLPGPLTRTCAGLRGEGHCDDPWDVLGRFAPGPRVQCVPPRGRAACKGSLRRSRQAQKEQAGETGVRVERDWESPSAGIWEGSRS